MKTLITASLLALGLLASPADARDMSGLWTSLTNSAPRSVFDQIRDSAPRSVFDQLQDTAPRSEEPNPDFTGELHPWFEKLNDGQP